MDMDRILEEVRRSNGDREREEMFGQGRGVKRRAACLPVITRRDKVIPGHK